MAYIDQFIRGLDLYDLEALRHDLLGKILTEHAGKENAIPYRELCHYYFDPRPIRIEDKLLISGMLQQARGILQENEWFLDYAPKRGWYAVKRTDEAFSHLLHRAKREVRLHHRTQVAAHIATGNHYQLPSSNPLVEAIHGVTPAIEQLEEAVENPEPPQEPPQLPEGGEE